MESNSVQSSNERFFDVLDACTRQIVVKMGAKPIAEWKSGDYNAFSSQLGKRTKVYLSENTIKRIFGRLKTPKRYFPQKATRDALAQFIGYRDWHEFELVQVVSPSSTFEPNETLSIEKDSNDLENSADSSIKKRGYFKIVLIACLTAFIIGLSLLLFYPKTNVTPSGVSLVCENPIGQVPHTAVFKLSSNHKIDSNDHYTLDFMDEGSPINISGTKVVTQFLRNPGVVYVKLRYKGLPIDTATVYLQTKGWVANSGNDSSRAFTISGLKPLSVNHISVSTSQLDSAGLNLSKPFLVGFSDIHSSSISGDNFEFSCELQTEESRPGVQCIESTIIILGEKSRHLVKLFKPSCVAFSEYRFSELNVTGTDKYLGAMGKDFKDGGKFRLIVKDKKVSLFVDNKKVLSTLYKQSIGRVMGIKIVFNGIAKVSMPYLYDLNSKQRY